MRRDEELRDRIFMLLENENRHDALVALTIVLPFFLDGPEEISNFCTAINLISVDMEGAWIN